MGTNNNKKKKQYTVEHTVHLRKWILLFTKSVQLNSSMTEMYSITFKVKCHHHVK